MTETRMTYREAVRSALREALANDPDVFLLGEDIGAYGGYYAATQGLLEEFGPERVRDTPLSELAYAGAGIGAALAGMKPIVEIPMINFSLLALDQIMNNAATLRHMCGGQVSVPIVIRMASGAGKQLAAQHSHSLEGWLAHIPGIRIVAPATVTDARGMLHAALQDPDPVIIVEHVRLYATSGEIETEALPDLDHAAIRREGRDVTFITYGGSLPKAMQAAEDLAAEGVEAEVVDLRSLRPLDETTFLRSVRKTHRAVVIDEGWRTGSLAAEISARIMEQAFYDLEAPVGRVCSIEIPIPYPHHLEEAVIPQPATIAAEARRLMGGA